MKRTKIAWVRNLDGTQGDTWNPVTGCLHGCEYCYAEKMLNRFKGQIINRKFIEDACVEQVIDGHIEEFIMEEHAGFVPTFWTSRLKDPLKLKKPSTIFVCSMADLFGDWVPDEWIEQVLRVVGNCPQHTFLFLTKNALRMRNDGNIFALENAWYGQTCTGIEPKRNCRSLDKRHLFNPIPNGRHYLSFEPLIGNVLPSLAFTDANWIIIGSLNQNGKPIHPDKGGTRKEWVTTLLMEADKYKIPVFIKPELYELYPDLPLRLDLPYAKA